MKTFFKLSLIALFLPVLTSRALTVTNIAKGCESLHSMFLKSDGSLWVMGFNYFGQLGDGTYGAPDYSTNEPEQIVANGVTAIAVGNAHSLLLKFDGSLWSMGYNLYG